MRILVVEDEAAIADFVVRGLRAEGYAVESATDLRSGMALARSGDFDLMIVDRMLPGGDGLDIIRSARERGSAIPAIVLSARSEIEDRVEGLDGGATDYVTKPFSFDELAARVRVHIRRPAQAEPTTIGVGDLRADLLARTVERGGTQIHLSTTEFDLLVYFMRHPGQVLSREQILGSVWGYDHDPGTNVVGVYVSYLRKKLGSGSPQIETVRGAGYRLKVP